MFDSAPTTPAYDLPSAHVAMIRHDLAASLVRHRRPLAARLVATTHDWSLVALDIEAIGSMRVEGTYGRTCMLRACELLAKGHAAQVITMLAGYCGLSDDEWSAETRREMDRAVSR